MVKQFYKKYYAINLYNPLIIEKCSINSENEIEND